MSESTKNFKFINPYNFIPMGKNKSKYKDDSTEKKLSGVIEYSVLTKTPLFIPNTSNSGIFRKENDDKDHKTYDFFSYTDLAGKKNGDNEYYMPVIPGSEIRGMFRNNFEILTNSCMSSLDSDMSLSKRTLESFSAGLLHRVEKNNETRFDLFEAKDVLWRTEGENNTKTDLEWRDSKKTRKCYIQEDYKEGEIVNYTEISRMSNGKAIKPLADDVQKYNSKLSTYKIGYIIKGEEGPKKHCCHIFRVNKLEPKCKNIKISLLDELLDIYEKNTLENASKYKEYKKELANFKAGKGEEYFPVYYSEVSEPQRKGKLFLSPSCKSREIYDNTLTALAKEFKPCTKDSGYCETCALFGTVVDDDNIASRIRFSDLVITDNIKEAKELYFSRPITLPELSSPKLNNMEFYLKKPKNAGFWTYDYYVDKKGDIHVRSGELNGRKFYWHQKIDNNFYPKEERINRNVTIRPIKTNVTFNGKLYFRDISKDELDKLICLINTLEDENIPINEKKNGYKIGMAKPLGLGSIACCIEKVKIKKYVIENDMVRLKNEEYNDYDLSNTEEKFLKETVLGFKKMTGFDTVKLETGEKFSYPKNKEEDKGYDWYTKNHKGLNRNNNEVIGMPNSRNDMIFMEYMEALEPRLKVNYSDKHSTCMDDNDFSKKQYSGRTHNEKNVEVRKPVVKKQVKKNEEVIAEFKSVQGKKIKFDTKGAGYPTFAWNEIAKTESDLNKENFKNYFEGVSVRLKCKGMVDNKYEYEYIGKVK